MSSRVVPALSWTFPSARSRAYWFFLQAAIGLAMLGDFIFRGLALSFLPQKTDFTELYASAWLWRHGLNFYDSALVTQTAMRLTGCAETIAPVYPPTTVVAVAPFTYLPWGWAQLLWLSLSLAGVGLTIWLLLRIEDFDLRQPNARLLALLVLAFGPLHQAFHLANIALLIVPLCLLGIALAEGGRDLLAGITLSTAAMLKPQLGIWILGFYLIQLRKKIAIAAAITAIPCSLLLFRYPVSAAALTLSYQQNIQHWFGVGRPFGFTEGAFPFNVNYVQIVLFQLWPSVVGVKILAQAIFAAGLAAWAIAMVRLKFRAPLPLALSSLWGLSFVSLYHSVSDTTALALVLCWAIPKGKQERTWPQRLAFAIFCLMLLPGHSVLIRIAPHLPGTVLAAWWWKLLVARYFVWLLLTFNAVLLYALVKAAVGPAHRESSPGELQLYGDDGIPRADGIELPAFAQS